MRGQANVNNNWWHVHSTCHQSSVLGWIRCIFIVSFLHSIKYCYWHSKVVIKNIYIVHLWCVQYVVYIQSLNKLSLKICLVSNRCEAEVSSNMSICHCCGCLWLTWLFEQGIAGWHDGYNISIISYIMWPLLIISLGGIGISSISE